MKRLWALGLMRSGLEPGNLFFSSPVDTLQMAGLGVTVAVTGVHMAPVPPGPGGRAILHKPPLECPQPQRREGRAEEALQQWCDELLATALTRSRGGRGEGRGGCRMYESVSWGGGLVGGDRGPLNH